MAWQRKAIFNREAVANESNLKYEKLKSSSKSLMKDEEININERTKISKQRKAAIENSETIVKMANGGWKNRNGERLS
jgi:ElaB/YqjD/DUF883 family membrane-anchored ribosome-binding protein